MRKILFPLAIFFVLSFTSAEAQDEHPCNDCHEVDVAQFEGTPHGSIECQDCHAGADRRHRRGLDAVNCGECHADVITEQAVSVHGKDGARRFEGAELPTCNGCHGEIHTMTLASDPASPVHASRLGDTCGTCHGTGQPAPQGVRTIRPIEAYTDSVHAHAVADGIHGAGCSDCHTAHSPLPATDPASSIHRSNVSHTCGACHAEIAQQFDSSIHGLAVSAGVKDSPVCTDCHGEHRILAVGEAGSPVSATNIPIRVCGPCHSDLRLGEKYGLPAEQVPSYEDSFHGLASRGGVQQVANCASCHGVHNILPSSDPASYIHEDNLASTCGKCHAGAGTRFAIGPVHVVAEETPNVVAYWIRAIYIPLIWVTVVGMVLHNLLDLVKKTRLPAARLRKPPENCTIKQRLSVPFRITHAVAALSFVLLVFSGFALKYPEGWWAAPLLAWESDFGLRGWLHRAAAVVIMGALGWHFVHLAMSRRARRCIAQMMPGLGDLREFRDRMAYYFGLRADEPPVPNVGYVEKAEYLAFMWGMVVMAVTGFLLWFENLALAWLPKWASDAATAIHWYEAILASLAILVWHFYWVIFDPVVYPMDLTWLTGKPPAARAAERSGEIETHADRAARRAGRREAG